ncbi:MAG: triose-phosphate isomerase [Candidatus Micrarchaeia archaeon]
MAEDGFIALNLKVYEESCGKRGIELAKIARDVSQKTGVRIVVCPNATLVRECAVTGAEVFAQHVDGNASGAYTGSITAKMLLEAGVSGSLINHSEKRINPENVKVSVEALKKFGLESMVCAKDVHECAQLAQFKPTYIAIEPPELIGSGVSVSSAKPQIVTGAVHAVREITPDVKLVCGAGVSTPEDVKRAFELGVEGVLIASAYVKATNPAKLLEQMAEQIIRQ